MFPLFLALMRGTAYAGVSINAVVVPVIIWKSTGSPKMAGLALCIEWIPKLWAYIAGGSLAARLGGIVTHRSVEILRMCMLGILAFAAHNGIWWLAAITASIYQVCNAISNICFEGMAHKYGTTGHTTMARADIASGLVIVPFSLLLSPTLLSLVGAIFHGIAFGMTFKAEKKGLYSTIAASEPIKIKEGLSRIKNDNELLKIISGGFLTGIAVAAAFSFLPAVLEQSNPSWGETGVITIFASVRAVISILFLGFFIKSSKEAPFVISGSLMALSWFSMALFPGSWGIFPSLACVAIGHSIFSIWSRQARQSLLNEAERLSLTGMLISVEASSYLAGAVLVYSLGDKSDFQMTIGIAGVIFSILGAFLLHSVGKNGNHNK